MSRGDRRHPDRILTEIRQRQPKTPEEVEEQLNLIEELVGAVSPTDDYQRAILEAINELARVMQGGDGDGAGAGQASISRVVQLLEQQVRGDIDTTDLPIGQIGDAVDTIPNGERGTALFDTWTGTVAAEIEADGDVTEDDTVVVVGRNNLARVEEDVEAIFATGDDPGRIRAEQTVSLANQVYEQSGQTLNPSTAQVSFSGDLQPGDTETVVSAQSLTPDFGIRFKDFGVTRHSGDVDNNTNTPDASVVRYHYQYQQSVNGGWEEIPGSPTVLPWGDLQNPQPVVSGTEIGPVAGVRIRFENRTDQTASQFTVSENVMSAIIRGSAVVL